MRCAIELPDVHNIVFVFQDSSFVIIYIQIVGGGENGHDSWKLCCACFPIHTISKVSRKKTKPLIPRILGLVCSDNGQQIIAFKKLTCCIVAKFVRVNRYSDT